jgi:Domain of unknown function (DUF4136)
MDESLSLSYLERAETGRCRILTQSKSLLGFFMLAFFIAAAPCMLAQKVKVAYDKNEDFSKFKTYAWVAGTPVASPAWNTLIRDNIDSHLQEKGLREVSDPKTADLLVNYHAAANTDLALNQATDPTYAMYGGQPVPGDTPWSTGTINSSVAYAVQKGTLAVHLFDRQQHQLVWVGTATGAVAESTEKKMKQVDKIMTEMFNKYPPK